MHNLKAWVAATEAAAADLYQRAATHFAADAALAAFLRQLAAEEEWHCRLLQSAAHLDEGSWPIIPDAETVRRIDALFRDATARLDSGAMTTAELYEVIAAAEFSEWNDFFLYCLGTLRGDSDAFRLAVAEISRHKAQIVAFFQRLPDGKRYLAALNDLPGLEPKRILVVERRPGLALLLSGALGSLGEVEVVESGSDGLALVARGHYDVVLSDVDMGTMDSADFYQRAIGLDPALNGRIVFFADQRAAEFSPEERVSLGAVVAAPAMLSQVCRAVALVARGERQLH